MQSLAWIDSKRWTLKNKLISKAISNHCGIIFIWLVSCIAYPLCKVEWAHAGRKRKFIKNALLTTNNQFDIGLMLHKKMTHPIIMNNQFHCDRNFDPTFHVVIASFKCLGYAHLLYEAVCLGKILLDLVVQYGN